MIGPGLPRDSGPLTLFVASETFCPGRLIHVVDRDFRRALISLILSIYSSPRGGGGGGDFNPCSPFHSGNIFFPPNDILTEISIEVITLVCARVSLSDGIDLT